MDDAMRKEIKAAVDGIFSEKEELDKRRMTEDELVKASETINGLNTSLEDANAELDAKNEEISGKDSEIADLQTQLEAAENEKTAIQDKLTETENKLLEIEKDRAAELRMAELDKAGVVRTDSESQEAKVREMSDEEFGSYKEELVAIKESIMAKLAEAEDKNPEVDDKNTEEAEEEDEAKEDETEEASEEDEEDVDPAQVDPDKAASAALNLEVTPSDSKKTKYAKLGQQMALNITKRRSADSE